MKGFSGEQYNYMLEFAIRQLREVYYTNNGSERVPITDLRERIQDKIKRLEKRKLK